MHVDARTTDELEWRKTLEGLERELAAMHALATAGGEGDPVRVLPELVRIFAKATESDRAAIYLFDPERGDLVMAASHGNESAAVEKYRRMPAGGITAQIAQTLRARALDPRDFPSPLRDELIADGYLQMAVVPLQLKGWLAGTLNLARTRMRPYAGAELRAAERLADQVAIQVERSRLHAESQRRMRQLSLMADLARFGTEAPTVAPLVARVLECSLDAFEVDSVMIHLLAEDTLVLAGKRRRGEGYPDSGPLQTLAIDDRSICGRAALGRRTVLVDFSSQSAATALLESHLGGLYAVATPLVSDDVLIGTICVVRRHERPFCDDDVHLLEACAAHVAKAIAHARLFEAERRRAHDLALINELGRLIAETLDLREVLSTGLRHLARIVDAPQAFLGLIDPKDQTMRVVASNLEDPTVLEIVIRPDEPSLLPRAIRERKPVIVADTSQEESEYSRTRTRYFGQRALLAVPLFARGEPIGGVLLGETREGHRFGPEAIERAVAVSNQLATAIANARLFEDLRQSYQKLESAQQRLVERERLAALGELAASVAHEVRNPLGVIFNSLAALRRMVSATPDIVMLLDIAEEEARRLNRIVGDLLDFARPSEPQIRHQSLEAVIRGAVEAAAAALGASFERFEIQVPRRLPLVPFDAQLVRQALINLMVNALQAAPTNGVVTVRATEDRSDTRRFARIDVSNTGSWIPPTVAQQIFQPFFTTKPTGTGLGLTIVKRIAEAHHGALSFESAEGTGTTFTLRLPLDEGEPAAPAEG